MYCSTDMRKDLGFNFVLEQGKNIPYIDPVILSAIKKYRWPGNIRELRNACERAVILCAGDTIQLSGFPAEIAVLAE